jgi:ATP-dependent RNA helicase DeaD
MQKPSFSELGLSAEILKAVEALGFEEASPIQAAAIPVLLQGKDVVGQSQTGSGKTAAFAIPAIEAIDTSSRDVQALILCPTRELATQVADEVHKLTAFKKGIHAVPIYGGASYDRQFYELQKGVQIVIGTPGRLIDHLDRGTLRLDRLKVAILDEADRMLDMGFRDDIQRILDATPPERQTVFFSATLSQPIRQLIKRYSRDPETIKIEQKAVTVPTVEQFFYEVRPRLKVEAVIRLIDFYNFKLGIIFCNTQKAVDDLADALAAQGIAVDRLHGGISQPQRTRVMNKFKKAEFEFLVATDVAGRGIDVDDLEVVVNYDLPYDPEDYVHRVGRTGRAGKKGMAATFVFGREIYKLQYIERFTRSKVRLARLPSAGEVEEKRADVLRDKVRAVLEQGNYRPQQVFVERLLEQGFNSTEIAAALVHMLMGGDDSPRQQEGAGLADEFQETQREAPPKRKEAPARAEREDAPPRKEAPVRAEREDAPKRKEAPVRAEREDAPPRKEAPVRAEREAAPKRKEAPVRAEREAPGVEAKRPAGLRKASRGMVWVSINAGRQDGIVPRDLVGLLTDEAGLPPKSIGIIELQDEHSLVQVEEKHLDKIIETVEDMAVGDRPLVLKVVRETPSKASSSAPFRGKTGGKKQRFGGPKGKKK